MMNDCGYMFMGRLEDNFVELALFHISVGSRDWALVTKLNMASAFPLYRDALVVRFPVLLVKL